MAGEDQKPPENPQQTPEQPPVSEAKKPETQAQGPNPTEVAGVELDAMRKKIETERRQKQERADFLQEESRKKGDKESWAEKPANNLSLIEGEVKAKIEEKMQKEMPVIEDAVTKAALDRMNVNIIKTAVINHVYEYCTKNFTAQELAVSKFDPTGKVEKQLTDYADNTLTPKLKKVIGEIQRIYESKKQYFSSAADCWEKFSTFAGLNIIGNGIFDASKLQETFLLNASAIDFKLSSYEQYVKIEGDLATLSGQEANLDMQAKAEKPGEKPDIGKLFAEGKLTLTKNIRLIIPQDANATDQYLKDTIGPALPESLEAANREAAITFLTGELKKMNPKALEVFEIAPNGQIIKYDVAAEKAKKEQAEAAIAKAEKPESKTDIGTIFSDFFNDRDFGKLLMGLIALFLGNFGGKGLTEGQEFMALDVTERKEAQEMKKAMGKFRINMETMRPLFVDAGQTKKILKQKETEKLDWDKFLSGHLSESELADLRQKKDMTAENIANMVLSPNEKPVAGQSSGTAAESQPVAQNQPAEQTAEDQASQEQAPEDQSSEEAPEEESSESG
jgi:hypothetical protein